jgi:hypothetical protein
MHMIAQMISGNIQLVISSYTPNVIPDEMTAFIINDEKMIELF